jgi:hypothetical protein
MEDIKIITMSGSMKFEDKMKELSGEIETKEGWCVLQCSYCGNDAELNKAELINLEKLHYKKIDLADSLFVVNVNGYVGESTKKEIEYAKKHNKEIIYLTDYLLGLED